MAKHSITIYNRLEGEGTAEKTQKTTAATTILLSTKVSNKNMPAVATFRSASPTVKRFATFGGSLAVFQATKKIIQTGVNVVATINEAATGDAIASNNARAKANLILNPISSARDIIIESYLGNLRVQRQNRSLEYQRQLTGNLAYSKSFNNGTF